MNFSCPNVYSREYQALIDKVGSLKASLLYAKLGDAAYELDIKPDLSYSPYALQAIDWLLNASDWKRAIYGLRPEFRDVVGAMAQDTDNMWDVIHQIAGKTGVLGSDGYFYYDSPIQKYAPKKILEMNPLSIGFKFFGMTTTGFINSQADPDEIRKVYNRYGYDASVKKAQSGAWMVYINGSRLGNYYNLDDSADNLDRNKGKRIREFLQRLSVPIEYVDSIVTPEGLSANAAVSIEEVGGRLNASIQAVYGVSDAVLGEEASHILVALLRPTVMYAEMMQDITSRPEYAEVVAEYGELLEYQDKDKLKEEAIAKVIVKYMSDIPVKEQDATWYSRVIQYFKSLFKLATEVIPNNPYAKLADSIINPKAVVANNTFSAEETKTIMYNLQAGQKWKQANLDGTIGKVATTQGDKYTLDGVEMGTRTTTVARAESTFRNKQNIITESQEAYFEEARTNGVLVHDIADKVVQNILAGVTPTDAEMINRVVYTTIQPRLQAIIDEARDKDPNVQVFTELSVVDPDFVFKNPETGKFEKGLGGTVDLLLIYSDGTADIYDYKTFGKKGITSYKLKEYNKQVAIYKGILQKGLPAYGIPPIKVNKSRIIPINLTIRKGAIITATVSSDIPVAYELVGDSVIDTVLISLYDRLAGLADRSTRNMTDVEIDKINIEIASIQNTIKETILNQSIDSIVAEAMNKLNQYLAEIDVADFSYLREMMDTAKNYEHYENILGDADSETAKKIASVTAQSKVLYQRAKSKTIELFGNDGFDLTADYISTSTMGRLFRGMRQAFRNPAGITMTKFLAIKSEKERQATKELFKEIQEKTKNLSREQFNMMVDKSKGRLISMFNSEFYSLRDKAIEENDLTWLSENIEIDNVKFEAARKRKKERLEKDRTITSLQRATILNEWTEANRQLTVKRFHKVKEPEKWYSSEYKTLQSDPAAFAFYEYFKDRIHDFHDMLGNPNIPNISTFIPKISSGVVEKLATDPEHTKAVFKRFTQLAYGEDPSFGNYDPLTGKPINSIPIYFIDNSVTPEQQSYDLDKLLFRYGQMAINHSLLSDIEDRLLLLEHIISTAQFVSTTAGGNPIISKVTGKLQKSLAQSTTDVEYFQDIMNYALYGIKDKQMTKAIHYADKALAFNAVRVLGANPISGIVNYTAGKFNQFIQGARGRYFSQSQLAEASKLIVTRDEKAYQLLDAMNFFQDIPSMRYAMTSLAKDRFLDERLLFAMLEYPELNIQFGTALAMMQNYTIYDGNIMLKSRAAQKKLGIISKYSLTPDQRLELDEQIKKQEAELPSLYDLAEAKDGKLYLNGEYNVELNAQLSGMIQELNKKIFGNMSPEDITGYKLVIIGRIIGQFRSWMPRTIDERFQELKYNEFLGDWEMGRYRSVIDHLRSVLSSQAENMRLSVLLSPEKAGKIAYTAYVEKYMEQYKKMPDITEQEFVDMHIANIKADLLGAFVTTGLLIGVFALGAAADDDDELKSNFFYKNSMLIAKRVYGELSFYVDPNSMLDLVRNPVALASVYGDFINLTGAIVKESAGQVFSNEDWIESAKPTKSFLKLVPVVRPGYTLMEDWADQYNIELGIK